ncbi:MAG: sigma-54-dependent Fis family transcriptional regulator [Ignavibacteriales bacterium]|nr:sigma-54-dependent Fis family transcriptional regulator [Ignavibacteriales bacterium]
MSQNLQVKLLRVLQEKEFERVGGEKTMPMTARIIAATNRNLEQLVKEGKFREDLFYRLKVLMVEIPPLRDRKEDIPLLTQYFLLKINDTLHKEIRAITDEALEGFLNYSWPGNVRELENKLLQAAVLTTSNVLQLDRLALNYETNRRISKRELLSLAEMEREHILAILEHTGWQKTKAAEILKISLPTLYSKIENYKLSIKNVREQI